MPDDLGIREASSDEKAADLKGHTRAERDRQLEELSEAVKLTQPTARETAKRIDTDKSNQMFVRWHTSAQKAFARKDKEQANE